MLEHGASRETLIEAAAYYRSHIRHVFTVNTLAYLIKGGRLSKFKGNLAEALDMNPSTVKSRLFRGRKYLRQVLKERGFDYAAEDL